MRKVILTLHLSIDGCYDHTKFRPDEDVFGYVNNLVQHDVGLLAYGRKMYQIMFPYWAEEENRDSEMVTEFAKKITGMDKIVFSRTLESAEYNARIVSTDPAAELLKLKLEPGKNIYLGTVSMLPELMQQGVIDEYHFIISPVIIGQGRRLLDDDILPEKLKLKLVDTTVFKAGTVALKYEKS